MRFLFSSSSIYVLVLLLVLLILVVVAFLLARVGVFFFSFGIPTVSSVSFRDPGMAGFMGIQLVQAV